MVVDLRRRMAGVTSRGGYHGRLFGCISGLEIIVPFYSGGHSSGLSLEKDGKLWHTEVCDNDGFGLQSMLMSESDE
jgi:streptogramin lyase